MTSIMVHLSWGSSPRMRGTPRRHASHRGGVGIIPAYAGNTITLSAMHEAYWDHPRVCGEHATGASTQVNCTGSSPRMRGTPAVTEATNNTARIIPAYAGNTPAACWKSWQAWDHPRVCGEHQSCLQRIRLSRGSSPRMRGTLRGLTLGLDSPGIIPAYAGNTSFEATFLPDPWDHPRVCGEHSPQAQNLIIAVGSSPRMRGTLRMGVGAELFNGIIPAYAGNTYRLLRL